MSEINGWLHNSKKRLIKDSMRRISEGMEVGNYNCVVKFMKDSNGDVFLTDVKLNDVCMPHAVDSNKEICHICKGTGNDYDAFSECEFPCFNCKNGFVRKE